ncbi:coiled-coil domain-containing protein 96 [Pangasianodon hypophthalmus]|uniref:coiled-coil domain-containing protein 96 n=1 Tax=Pangasianodon hypophthalmus TaxID=310915 RepID=UPI0023071C21|nr:coiled-coil domain-containing protein 96 [Pangasianodon hypophthalmus]XP_026765921.3 coiled-coil domain-containing protein 96 [Pangasianodon hypophthalmus]XP_034159895.2 coiled-coil domain-containing protein 96 [Pangasianodon hypophthalmus]
MEEQSLEEMDPDLKSEDPNVAEAADVLDSDELTKPDEESCAEEVEVEAEETGQAANEEDEVNTQNAPEKPEEEFEASVRDDLSVSDDFEEKTASDVEIFQNEKEEEEPESQVEGDHKQCAAELQHNLKVDSEHEQELLRELQTEHEKLSELNYQLQTKLAEYFWVKSGGELQSVQEKFFPNQDCFQKYPDIIEDVKRLRQDKKQKHLQHRCVDDLHRENNEKLEQIEREWSMLASAKREVIFTDLEPAMGKMEAQAVAERLLTAAQECEDEFVSVRNENFKLNLKMPKLEAGLHVREEDLDGEMQRIDFEQLNIENQSYSEKIQECKEDLLKLKKTFPHTGQILMHVKEKLRFVQMENQAKRVHFDELDALVLQEQEALTQTMQARDILRFDNLRKRQDCGLLGNSTLLRDLEDTVDECEALERQVEMLKRS